MLKSMTGRTIICAAILKPAIIADADRRTAAVLISLRAGRTAYRGATITAPAIRPLSTGAATLAALSTHLVQ